LLLKDKYAIFNEECQYARWHRPHIKNTYYVDPRCEIERLHALGFGNVRIFALNGTEIKTVAQLNKSRDPWLYFMCQARDGMQAVEERQQSTLQIPGSFDESV